MLLGEQDCPCGAGQAVVPVLFTAGQPGGLAHLFQFGAKDSWVQELRGICLV